MADEDYNWIPFYMEFADKLLEYKYNREELIEKVLRLWDNIDMDMPLLETDNHVVDMDPFTVFALFNKHLTDDNRISILDYMKSEFGITADVPTSFTGIPPFNEVHPTFYYFTGQRGEKDIDNLWDMFEIAIKYANSKTKHTRKIFLNTYNKVIKQKGVNWQLIYALFWIRPYEYINLDSPCKTFLSNPDNFDGEVAGHVNSFTNPPSAFWYIWLCDRCRQLIAENDFEFNNFPELSYKVHNLSLKEKQKENNDSDEGIGDSEDIFERNYWLYTPGYGSRKWDKYYKMGLMGIGWGVTGDLTKYSNKNQIIKRFQRFHHNRSKYTLNSLALWQFANEIKVGDVIFVKKGLHEIIGYGIVQSEYFYDESIDNDHYHFLRVDWKEKGSWKYKGTFVTKFLTRITDYLDDVQTISNFFETSPDDVEQIPEYPEYTAENFLSEAYISREDYITLTNLLKYKKNIILQGAPGVGKTFISKRLAYSLIGFKDKSKVTMVQFHQSYNYEDFIMGYRPSGDGFELSNGVFYDFCKKARDDEENSYYFIIDEINRGNLSKIFGELFMLIENDKRGSKNKIQLLYNDELFYIPENVYIIGMMNTADRSLALLDYALRRRFTFYSLKPAFDSDNFTKYMNNLNNMKLDNIINLIKELNTEIADDESLGEGFMIGHSYFTNLKPENANEKLKYVIEYEIIPLLEEYWFDEEDKADYWKDRLRSVVNDSY